MRALEVIDGNVFLLLDEKKVMQAVGAKLEALQLPPDELRIRLWPPPRPTVDEALANPYGIAVDATHVYWVDRFVGQISRVPIGGGKTQIVAKKQPRAFALSVDSSHVYFTVAGNFSVMNGAVRRVPKQGGGIEQIATSQLRPEAIAVGASAVFWASRGYAGALDGAIVRWLKQGGEPTLLAVGLPEPSGIALGANDVFFSTRADGSVLKVTKRGGPQQLLVGDQDAIIAVASDAQRLSWTHGGGVTVASHASLAASTRVRAGAAIRGHAICGDAVVFSDAAGHVWSLRDEKRTLLARGLTRAGALGCDVQRAYVVTHGGRSVDAVSLAGGSGKIADRQADAALQVASAQALSVTERRTRSRRSRRYDA